MAKVNDAAGVSVDEDDVRALEAAGLVDVEDGVARPGSRFETLMPVLRALDAETAADADGALTDSVGDDPPDESTDTGSDPTGAELVSLVAHDLRGPLAQASGWLSLARADGDEEYFDAVEAAHKRIDERIDDLVLLASDAAPPTMAEHVSVAEAADRVWADLVSDGTTDDGRLVVEGDREVVAVPDRLERLLENLFSNALAHGRGGDDSATDETAQSARATAPPETNGGGPVPLTVRVGRLPDGFYVEDDGVGIPASEHDRVLDAGYSMGDGSGLGLASVEQIATTHGWTVTVTESEAGGARFEFTGAVASA